MSDDPFKQGATAASRSYRPSDIVAASTLLGCALFGVGCALTSWENGDPLGHQVSIVGASVVCSVVTASFAWVFARGPSGDM